LVAEEGKKRRLFFAVCNNHIKGSRLTYLFLSENGGTPRLFDGRPGDEFRIDKHEVAPGLFQHVLTILGAKTKIYHVSFSSECDDGIDGEGVQGLGGILTVGTTINKRHEESIEKYLTSWTADKCLASA
jgi:hypothetical protein